MMIYDQIESNKRKSVLLVGFFLVLVIAVGWIFAQAYNSPIILYVAVIISVGQALIGYYSGDKIALSVSGAKEIQKNDNMRLWRIVENLAITAGLPMPKVYIIQDPAPNAFATGKDPKTSSLAVTSGLLDMMTDTELEGVVAHELSHIGNYDIRLMTLVVVLVGIIALVSDIFIRIRFWGFGDDNNNNNGPMILLGILAAILAPIVATLVQLAISRKREFLADSTGSLMTRYPEGLASALEKIGQYTRPMQKTSSATSHLYIANPFGKENYISKIFSTHPPIAERIKLLRGIK